MHGKIVVRRRLKRKMQRAESGIKISRIPFSPEAEPPAAPLQPVPVLNKSWKHWDVGNIGMFSGFQLLQVQLFQLLLVIVK
jgi:hypothetical protein